MAVSQEIQVTEADYLGAIRLNMRPRKALRILGSVMLGLFALVVCEGLGTAAASGRMTNGNWGGLFFLIYFPLWYFVIIPFQGSRRYRTTPLLGRPATVEFAEEHVRFTSEVGEATVPWEDFVKWKRNKTLLLLYTSARDYAIVPLEFFTDEETVQVLAQIEAKLGPVGG